MAPCYTLSQAPFCREFVFKVSPFAPLWCGFRISALVKAETSAIQIVIVGAGGLGVPAAWGLCKAIAAEDSAVDLQRIVQIHLIDPDTVALSNLNRQVLYGEEDIGRAKVLVLKERLLDLFPGAPLLEIEAHHRAITPECYERFLAQADFVLDCCDDSATKFGINDYCVQAGIPFSYAGVLGDSGVCILCPAAFSQNEHPACLRCLFGDFSPEDIEEHSASCSRAGIVGAAAGALGFMQAELALRFLSGSGLDDSEEVGSSRSTVVRLCSGGTVLKEASFGPSSECPFYREASDSPDASMLDLSAEQCPMTFLYAKLALEKLLSGEKLCVQLPDREATERVARSMREEGHVVSVPSDKGSCVLLIERN